MSLRLFTWISEEQLAALERGEPVASEDAHPEKLAGFCARNRIPYAPQSTALACFLGEVPLPVAARQRGRVRVRFDVSWLLEEIRLVTPSPFEALALAVEARAQLGLPVWTELRQFHVLGGAPADRGEAIAGLVARTLHGPGEYVEARVLRPFDLDDVDEWSRETGLPVIRA